MDVVQYIPPQPSSIFMVTTMTTAAVSGSSAIADVLVFAWGTSAAVLLPWLPSGVAYVRLAVKASRCYGVEVDGYSRKFTRGRKRVFKKL